MQMISEPDRQIPVVAEADAVVCGGPGSFAAAIAAARRGAKTVLIERYGFMGTCIAIGQAAGTVAALATAAGVAPADLDARPIQEALREDGQLV